MLVKLSVFFWSLETIHTSLYGLSPMLGRAVQRQGVGETCRQPSQGGEALVSGSFHSAYPRDKFRVGVQGINKFLTISQNVSFSHGGFIHSFIEMHRVAGDNVKWRRVVFSCWSRAKVQWY